MNNRSIPFNKLPKKCHGGLPLHKIEGAWTTLTGRGVLLSPVIAMVKISVICVKTDPVRRSGDPERKINKRKSITQHFTTSKELQYISKQTGPVHSLVFHRLESSVYVWFGEEIFLQYKTTFILVFFIKLNKLQTQCFSDIFGLLGIY